MPYKCTKCSKIVNDKRLVDGLSCDHNLEPLHDPSKPIGHTKRCPECTAVKNDIMSRMVNGYEIECCFDCANHRRAGEGQEKATEPPKTPVGYNLENPDPGTIWSFGPNDKPILETLSMSPENND